MSLECLDAVISQQQFGVLVGLSEGAVSELKTRGVIKPGGTARAWLRSYIEQLRAAASGRSDATGELTLARIRESNAKAAKAEIEAAQQLGLLVDAREAERSIRDWISRGVQAIDSAERKIIDHIESGLGVSLEDHHVREHLRTAKRDLAAYRADLVRDIDEGGDGMAPARTGTYG